ncbi:MAG: NAD(P)-dependent oxidoreductase [Lachnospiraceae bacterium]|nr:NAD(P)-dependent oxidoreductase [Lachnospiraceae bacterium]
MSIYLITGATGYIGSQLIRYLHRQDKNNRIIALVRNVQKAEKMFEDDIDIRQIDLSKPTEMERLEAACDYIIHCASITKSSEMVSHPVEVIESIVNTTQNILEYARQRQVKSMVYLSSMEVYGNIDCSDGHKVSEQELGDIDICSVRSCYPLGKRMAENICYSYYKEYRVPVKIARLAQTFGQGILPDDNRVFAQFANSVKRGTDIVLHTDGSSMGNYCSISDAVSGILTILDRGVNGEIYNVVNETNTMSIRDMAELVASEVAHHTINVSIELQDTARTGYAPNTGLRLSGEKLQRLGWEPTENIIEMYTQVLKS